MIIKYKNYTPKIGENAWVAETSSVIGDVEMAEDSAVWFGCVVRGDVHSIRIGKRSNIQDLSMIHTTHHKGEERRDDDGNPTYIGDDVTVGHRVMLHGCKIEDACLIGMSATILDGAVIGKESIVGAGSLVTKGKKFPPRSLIMGSPAKVVRELTDDEVAELYASARRYVEFKNSYTD
ncbi:isoleucine patch superfamily enzyme, carbonic anhydrase/acetyltransferase [Thiovulum sp. ES]|nr:isoleucine patch superfamily enzyme, carbonic anhydrase/acetyltransferase [Thiovulum sp. ES]